MRTIIQMSFGDKTTINDMKSGMKRVMKEARIKPKSIEIIKIIRSGAKKYVRFLVKY